MSGTYKDCPQDIRDTAAHIVACFGSDGALLQGAIAAALDNERAKAEWQDISTAPRDRMVLVYNGFAGVYVSQFDGRDWPCGMMSGTLGTWYPVPTHWMPLPSPPTPTNDTQSKTLARAV